MSTIRYATPPTSGYHNETDAIRCVFVVGQLLCMGRGFASGTRLATDVSLVVRLCFVLSPAVIAAGFVVFRDVFIKLELFIDSSQCVNLMHTYASSLAQ